MYSRYMDLEKEKDVLTVLEIMNEMAQTVCKSREKSGI